MRKNFVFMFINTLFLPLTHLDSIKGFLTYVFDQSLTDVPTMFSHNLVQS